MLAATSPTACGECGAPWRRVVASERIDRRNGVAVQGGWTDPAEKLTRGRAPRPGARCFARRTTVGWEPGCDHADGSGHCLVLDPFAGSGTTGLVACRHGRDFLGIELEPGVRTPRAPPARSRAGAERSGGRVSARPEDGAF